MPHVSIIVPAYNACATLAQCLTAIRSSDYLDYELIVVDDNSRDETLVIARQYADNVVELKKHVGISQARNEGASIAQGEILVNIDADIVIKDDTLKKIADYFLKHPDVDALTGLLSKEHPNSNFFSQYKNLYMHDMFSRLSGKISFLFASVCAIRRDAFTPYDISLPRGVDTELGQRLFMNGKTIALVKALEVVHLKRYHLFSFLRNDFRIPFNWAKIFLKYKGWRQMGRYKTGFAHSPKEQLASVFLAPIILFVSPFAFRRDPLLWVEGIFLIAWLMLNMRFFVFLFKEKGCYFVARAVFVTFFDNVVMALGILCGFFSSLIKSA